MADLDYSKALKQGEKAYKNAQGRGENPYLPVLDEILREVSVKSEVSLGLVEIPLEQIVGTKTAGRANAFAPNFMPLMKENSEFAVKWQHVYEYQMTEGVSDPVIAYEYMNRFYILEGNKRVSVLKYLNASAIEGYVTRIVPAMSEDPQVILLYEFMKFYSLTEINDLQFRKTGSFLRLLKACGKDDTTVWTEEERKDFRSRYIRFSKFFEEKNGRKQDVSAAEAFLLYLELHAYDKMDDKTDAEIRKELSALWEELPAVGTSNTDSLKMDPDEEQGEPLLKRVLDLTRKKKVRIAFIHDKDVAWSGWTYGHELGRMHLEQVMGDRIETKSYVPSLPGVSNADAIIEDALAEGNQIIFTTSERYVQASLKAALAHPEVKILNCSVNHTYHAIRTYYGRMYEIKYLEGMIAGAMCTDNRIAYVAEYPIYGEIANINAFARGVMSTRPGAKVYLFWNSEKGADLAAFLKEKQIKMVSDIDMIRPGLSDHTYGLYLSSQAAHIRLAAPLWNWGKFYEKIVKDVMKGSFSSETAKNSASTNYWWGISGGIVDMVISRIIPSELRMLTEAAKASICSGGLHPFGGVIRRSDGTETGEPYGVLSPEEIITMDWLVENVIGEIPAQSLLTEEGKSLVEIQGVEAARLGNATEMKGKN